jgi:hypothetical protein
MVFPTIPLFRFFLPSLTSVVSVFSVAKRFLDQVR